MVQVAPPDTSAAPLAPGQPPSQNRDAARRVCAALLYNQTKARQVFDVLASYPHSHVAQHDGLSSVLVLAHAAAARKHWRRHNLIILAASCVPMLVVALATRSVLLLLGVVPLTVGSLAVVRMLVGLYQLSRQGLNRFFSRERDLPTRIFAIVLLIIVSITLSPLFLLALLALPILLMSQAGAFTFGGLAALIQRAIIQSERLQPFRPRNWRPEPPPIADPYLSRLCEQLSATTISADGAAAHANATVYSGFSPFVGAGYEQWHWEDSVELQPINEDEADNPPAPPPASEITARLIGGLHDLDLPGSTIRRWHFVSGTRAPDVPGLGWSHGRPLGHIDSRAVAEGRIDATMARTYIWVGADRWDGDVVFNSFLRIQPGELRIFIEVGHFVVPPIDPSFDRCDLPMDITNWRLMLTMLGESLVDVLKLPDALLWDMTRPLVRASRSRRVARLSRNGFLIDYGAPGTVRDLFSSKYYRYYFQRMDAEEQASAINAKLLTTIDEFLENYGLEVARPEALVNSLMSINVVHGDVNADGDVAFGNSNRTGGKSTGSAGKGR